MNDLKTRLRRTRAETYFSMPEPHVELVNPDGPDAADRIERLEADKAAWRGIHEGAVLALQERIRHLETGLQSVADLTERWDDSLISQINEVVKDTLSQKKALQIKLDMQF